MRRLVTTLTAHGADRMRRLVTTLTAHGADRMRRIRTITAALALLGAGACTGGGINAGEQGGEAFIGLAVMLIIGAAILWFALGRED